MVDQGVFGIAAVGVEAGELDMDTKVFSSPAAELTTAAHPGKPGYANQGAGCGFVHTRTGFVNYADNFMARDQGEMGDQDVAFNFVDVGVADTAGKNPDPQLVRSGLG